MTNKKEKEDEASEEESVIEASVEEAEVVEAPGEEKVEEKKIEKGAFDVSKWNPKTTLGKMVKEGKVTEIGDILDRGERIMEAEIVDVLIPNIEADLLMIGQSKGKFGGGQRRVFRQTQKKTQEGNKPKFSTYAVVGNRDGFVGGGLGKSKETVPAREKALREAKLNIIKIRRGCGSWECNCKECHSIPFSVEGKAGSVRLRLMPAPKGKGLCAEKEIAKILGLAGIKDVWSKSLGHINTKVNMIEACFDALRKLSTTKIVEKHIGLLNINEGKGKARDEKNE
ncbi:30S ribosomal protein S5 [Candidatus Woesearchaeota archaeon]|nr:30S ribosomal protein S5 [Candidatus Woesearchaeota archaeon]